MLFDPPPCTARVIPIHPHPRGWQSDLLHHLLSNPKHLEWVLARPLIAHFLDDILFSQIVQSRAEQVTLYHSAWRFEVDFHVDGLMQRVEMAHQRWALPISLALKRRAGMDLANPVIWQFGEIALPCGLALSVTAYPNRVSERLVLRPRWSDFDLRGLGPLLCEPQEPILREATV